MAKFDKRLKSILVKEGALETAKADEAYDLAQKEGRTLTEVLLDRSYLDEKELIAGVAVNMGIPPIDVGRIHIEDTVLDCLPQDLARYYGVLPVAKIGDLLTLAVSNPFDILKLDDIRIVTGCEIRPVVSTEKSIQKAISRIYDKGDSRLEEIYSDFVDPEMELAEAEVEEDVDLRDISGEAESSPVVKMVNLIVFQGIKGRVSDIHIEPMEKRMRIRYRKDGILVEKPAPNKKFQNAITSRIKIMAGLDIAEKRVPQDGKFQIRMEGRPIDFRVSVLPTLFGEKVVMRILDSSMLALSLDQLGFEEYSLKAVRRALSSPFGMILVTGPTGSGKTTTLYSSLREVMTIEDNIITVEDPVEYQLEGINQVPVNPKRGMTFAAALRSILRQDPDTIMVGEMRDLETIEIAVRAALTGHLVLSTLHTNDAPGTVTRLVDMGVDPFLVCSTVVIVCAQRLMRKLCPECRGEVQVPEERFLKVGFKPEEIEGARIFKAVGCHRCSGGYNGRFAVLETMVMTDGIKRLIMDGANELTIKKKAIEEGMITMRRAGLLNCLRGRTSIEEVLRVTTSDEVRADTL
jgi:type IV pilus assembly protein PilB